MYVGSMSMYLSCGCGLAAYGKMLPQLNEDGAWRCRMMKRYRSNNEIYIMEY